MNYRRVTTTDAEECQNWCDFLDKHPTQYQKSEELIDGQIHYVLRVDPTYEKLLKQYKETGKAPATLATASKGMKVFVGIIVALALIVIVGVVVASEPSEPAPESVYEMNDQQYQTHLRRTYGYYTPWLTKYTENIKTNYVNNPRTFEVEEVRLLPIDRDSFTHVLLFSAENAFGVRKDHSITSVVGSQDGQVHRVVNIQ